ncbi:VOC family protein [Phyllobacterium sp. SB3]|uniref:VOC family protein n=1 Tax=Phyllobacterium sp. SB3 TaxID=3156073 RepID=UPI0032AF2D99
MIDHTGIIVSDFEAGKKFYSQTLGAIGYSLIVEFPASVTGSANVAGFGENGKPDFWVISGTPNKPLLHVAFRVNSPDVVDAFYKAGLAAGGADNGKPGLRPRYHPNYYGAYVHDADGHNIEAVCHEA